MSNTRKIKVPSALIEFWNNINGIAYKEIQNFFKDLEDRDLIGEIYAEKSNLFLADAVAVTNGTITAGDVTTTQTINQEYFTVQETGQFQIDYTFVDLGGDPARIEFVGRYDGNVGHVVRAQFYNYTTLVFDDATVAATDFPASTTDYTVTFDYPIDSSDYISGGTAIFRITHTSPSNNAHYCYTDFISLLDKTAVLTNAGTFYPVTGATNGIQHRTLVDGPNGTITVLTGGYYTITMSVSFYGLADTKFYGHIYVDGVQKEDIGLSRYIGSGGDVGSATMNGVAYINAGSVVDVRAASTKDNAWFGLDHFNLMIRATN